MAGGFRNAAAGAGRWILHALKLSVLASWFGGGLAVGLLVPHYLQNHFRDDPDAARKVEELTTGGITKWFNTGEAIGCGAVCLLLFFLEKPRKAGFVIFLSLAIAAAINQYGIRAWMSDSDVLPTVYQTIFFSEIAIALVYLLVLGMKGVPAPAPAALAPEVRPMPVPVPVPPVARAAAGAPPLEARPPPALVSDERLPAAEPIEEAELPGNQGLRAAGIPGTVPPPSSEKLISPESGDDLEARPGPK